MDDEGARERIQTLLVTGDNRLKQGVALETARASYEQARVLMLTGSNATQDVDRARRAGAAGYVTKDRIAAELIEEIVRAAAG